MRSGLSRLIRQICISPFRMSRAAEYGRASGTSGIGSQRIAREGANVRADHRFGCFNPQLERRGVFSIPIGLR